MPAVVSQWQVMAFFSGVMALLSERHYQSLPLLTRKETAQAMPPLSIIIPARNEASNLRRLLPTLRNINYAGDVELIVIDDASSDETGFVAKQYASKVIHVDHPSVGWMGKPYACHQGALAASGEWLLFTDADVRHAPNGPARAVDYALRHRLDALSVFLKQVTTAALDRLIMMVAFAGLFTISRAEQKTFNGQYILIRRSAYFDSGGFQAVAGEVVEDMALGHHLRSQGFSVRTLRTSDIALASMSEDRQHLWHGLKRISAGSLPWIGASALLTILFVTGVFAPLLICIAVLSRRRSVRPLIFSWAAVGAGFLPWANRFGTPWLSLLAPFGACAVLVAASLGLINRLLGRGVYWKGRRSQDISRSL